MTKKIAVLLALGMILAIPVMAEHPTAETVAEYSVVETVPEQPAADLVTEPSTNETAVESPASAPAAENALEDLVPAPVVADPAMAKPKTYIGH